MGIHKLSQNVWDKLTAVEKKEFSQLLKAQTGNLEMTSNPPFIVSKEASDKFKWKDKINFGPMTPGKITPAGHIQLTTKEVTKKVHLPYTVVEEEIIDENELELKYMVDGAISNQLPPAPKKGNPLEVTPTLYDKAKKMIFGVDPAKGKDESMVSVWSNQDDVLSLQNQTKTIFNKPYNESPDFMKPKDPSLLKYYVMPINYEDWDQFPQLKVKYKIGSHHKYEGTVFEVVNHDKDILHQQFKITMKEDEFIGMTGPDDHLMDGIEGPGVTVGGTTMEDLFGGDAAILDELSITPPADDIELKKRSERSKMFYELTHKVKL